MKTLILALILIPLAAYAQQLQPVTSQQADCGKFLQPAITTAGTFNSATVDNRFAACDGWVVTYSSFGFATVSVLLQSAPLTTAGAAGTFISFAGTIVTGSVNPTTATNQGEIRATGYFPYVRVQITTTGTGYLTAEFHGFKTNPNSGNGAPASTGCPNPCPVVGTGVAGTPAGGVLSVQGVVGGTALPVSGTVTTTPSGTQQVVGPAATGAALSGNPVNVGTSDGVNVQQPFICTLQTPVITLSDATRTVLVAASGSTSVRICHIHFTTSGAAEEFTVSTGTGSACGTGTAVIDDFLGVTAIAMDFQPTAALRSGASNAVCVTQSGAAQTAKVVAVYAQF